MTRSRPGRTIGVLLGTFVILGLGIYGPATLLGPLPAVGATVVDAPADTAKVVAPNLPDDGSAAVVLAGSDTPLATSGSKKAVPMAAITKIVTALVVLDAKPLKAGESGPDLTIGADDYSGYIDYSGNGARAVVVFPGEKWSEQEMLQAMILGSSNNHADSLARWAYGSVDDYVTAANTWLADNDLDGIHVDDATGLSEDSAGTASDVAKLAALAMADPTISDIIENPATSLVNDRGVENTTSYLPDLGVTGISRSFTDEAGVCFLFTATIGSGDGAVHLSGAFLREPSYDTLEGDVKALVASATKGTRDVPLITKGGTYATFTAPWGDTAEGVALLAKAERGWQTKKVSTSVTFVPFSTANEGRHVGRVAATGSAGDVSVPLVVKGSIRDPGAGWRLLHPIPMISTFIESMQEDGPASTSTPTPTPTAGG